MTDSEIARLIWVEGQGFILDRPGVKPFGPIQSVMMLEAALRELEHEGWVQTGGTLSVSGYYPALDTRPMEDLTFKRSHDAAESGRLRDAGLKGAEVSREIAERFKAAREASRTTNAPSPEK